MRTNNVHHDDPVNEDTRLYFRCRREGVTIRSAIECLMARAAIEHDRLLLRDEKNLERVVEIIAELELA